MRTLPEVQFTLKKFMKITSVSKNLLFVLGLGLDVVPLPDDRNCIFRVSRDSELPLCFCKSILGAGDRLISFYQSCNLV